MEVQKATAASALLHETESIVVFHTQNKTIKAFIRFVIATYKTLLITGIFVELVALLVGIFAEFTALLYLFLLTIPDLFILLLTLYCCVRMLRGPFGNPVLTLSSDGLTLKTFPFLATIPWDEIASVEAGNLIGISNVIIKPKDWAALRMRLGKGGRYLWMYARPGGGLGIPYYPFALSPADLAARINHYRERSL